jgi:hypothetical protein
MKLYIATAKSDHLRELTMTQLDLAWHLAKDFPFSQCKDFRLSESSVEGTSATPDVINPKPQEKASAAAEKRKRDGGWENAAFLSIRKKKLSLDREWNEITWFNKSSRNERLKLLKDDGVDITSLQAPNISSEVITRAVLAQIDRRKQQSSASAPAQSTRSNQIEPVEAPAAVNDDVAWVPDPAFAHLEYHPLVSPTLKRKQNKKPDLLSVEISRPSSPPNKKRCTIDLRMTNQDGRTVSEEETPTWELLKDRVLADIFTLTKTMRRRPALRSPCRIIISFPSQSTMEDVPGDFELSSTGYDHIIQELKVLHDTVDNDDNIGIHDPAAPATPPGIRVITNKPRRTIFEGHAPALIGFMRRLCTPGKGLAHIAKRHFSDEGVRKTAATVYELGTNTQKQLEKIQEALFPAVEGDDVEIHVRWIYMGKTVPWSEKFF